LEYDENDRLPAACDLSERAVSLGVMSKSFGLPGLRIGWVATRNAVVFELMASYKDYTTICNSAPSEFLSTIGLKHRETLWKRNRGLLSENLALLEDFFGRREDSFNFARPRAGCIAFPELKAGGAERFCAEVLEKSGVLLAPSSRFSYGDRHFRVGFGRKSFAAALRHFDAFLG
jgi:aspartate/methionine/tyrosine aminotransferase